MNNSIIKIAFSCNNNWIDKLCTTIISILKNAKKEDSYLFYILDSNITDFNKQKIAQLKSDIKFSVEYLEIDKNLFKNAPLTHHFKIETYYRLSLPSILNEDKILYMDVDTLVKKDISQLYNIDLEDYYAGAVEDILSKTRRIHKLNVKKYFNAGVLLLNLKKIRQDNLEEQFFYMINNNSHLITYVDQCVLNNVFKENVKFLDKKYNFQHHSNVENINKIYKKHKKNIVVLHFISNKKPWKFQKTPELNFMYFLYHIQTPFKKEIFTNIFLELKKRFELSIYLAI